MTHKVPIQSLIDHIKTAVDVDPWAKEMVEELLKEQRAQNVVNMRLAKDWDRAASCPKCNESLKWVYHRNYCGYCGQAVKWDGRDRD